MADRTTPLSFNCENCDKKYQHNRTLKRHLVECHGVEPASNYSCREDGCGTSFTTTVKLRSHLVNDHSLPFVDETKEFASIDDFQRWKEDLERTEHVHFAQRSGTNKETDYTRSYFYCHRSGSYTSHSKSKRMAKESCRTGEFCTAYIAIRVDTVSGEVSAKFCKTHYKHDRELRHLRLSSSEKAWVAAQCAQKVGTSEILNNIRNSVQDSPERVHLITRQDITNIKYACSLRKFKRNGDDRTNLMMQIEELKALGDQSPILYCKWQGDHHENLPVDDVFLVIQSPLQQQMLKEFGGSIICLDATYGTNGNGFKLTSVLAVDEFGEGFPAAWCISSRDDLFTLREFFQVLFNKCGFVNPKWIMTDDAEQYYEAWVNVFGFGPKKLLCTWQMDRAWREKLNLIQDQQLQCDVYKILRFILEERSEERFAELVEQVKKELMNEKTTEAFGDYIRNTYLSRPKQWAFCHRLQLGLDTNCEALHSVVNDVYMQGDSDKRLDRCIFTVISLINNKGIDGLSMLESGKTTSKLTTTVERHKTSMKLSLVEDKGDMEVDIADLETIKSCEDFFPVITNIESLQSSQDFSPKNEKRELLRQLATLTHQISASNTSDLAVFSEAKKHLNAVLNLFRVKDTPAAVSFTPNAVANKRPECPSFSTNPKETRRPDNAVVPMTEGNTTVNYSLSNNTNLRTTGLIFILPKPTYT